MNYQETLSFLYEQLPVYQKYGASAIKKDLTNIRLLCHHLDTPQSTWPSIHIAGTNGKGTVSHMIGAVLQAQGLKVGLYTSPHYTDFRERIKVNGAWISERFVTDFVSTHKEMISKIEPSFFEITVAMAFDYFRSEEVDIAIIETGLGGRLDSTNIVQPLLSVITHISLDHMSMLGTNVYQIAHEKAGIIKSETPVVIGKYQNECDSVFFNRARLCNSSISFASLRWRSDQHCIKSLIDEKSIKISKHIEAESPFLIENATTAIEALTQYQKITDQTIAPSVIEHGIMNYRQISNYIGRWQVVHENPKAIADSAHNVDALSKVISNLSRVKHTQLRIVLGFVKDKDIDQIIALLPKDAVYYFVAPSIFRALPTDSLYKKSTEHHLNGQVYKSVIDGYNAALSDSISDDLIFIGGSSFVVGDLLLDLPK